MENKPHISLIFVNYKSAQYLATALKSIVTLETRREFFEIIVVNNDPRESVTLQRLCHQMNCIIIESGRNIGFGQGSNRGAHEARGEILIFVNPDTVWQGVFLQDIYNIFLQHPRFGVLGMTVIDNQHCIEKWSFGHTPSLKRLFWNNIFPSRGIVETQKPFTQVDWVSGCGLCVRKDLFCNIGGFDKQFFLYFEDTDLCTRICHRNFQVIHHTELPLLHFGGKSQASKQKQKVYFSASQRLYFQKHRPYWEQCVLIALQWCCRRRISTN
ncbi:MAG: glycosyltransferase [Minisyncoccota bacterium]